MNAELLDSIPLWCVFALATAFILLALELGYRLGQWRHAHAQGEKDAPTGAMVAAILGLVAFMLAFTFSLAAARFDARRMAVLDEANAIGTTYLRTRLLPEPERTDAAQLLRDYVDVRVRIVQQGTITEGLAESEVLHRRLWSSAVAAAEKDPSSIMTGLFIQSLNDVIDMHAKRVLVGIRSRIPMSIWVALFTLALVGMSAMGYQAGLSVTRRSPAMLFLALAFGGVLFLIVDLDRVREGFLNVGQQAMLDLQTSMQSELP
jgi:hypothetical protein